MRSNVYRQQIWLVCFLSICCIEIYIKWQNVYQEVFNVLTSCQMLVFSLQWGSKPSISCMPYHLAIIVSFHYVLQPGIIHAYEWHYYRGSYRSATNSAVHRIYVPSRLLCVISFFYSWFRKSGHAHHRTPQLAKFMGSTWGTSGSCRPQMGTQYFENK